MFVTLEGIEGSGKSTLSNKLATWFTEQGKDVLLTREPGGCSLGKKLRPLLLHTDAKLCAEAELFLFLADRAQHVAEIIRPALQQGRVVLCDRYADSTIVYQGYGRGFDPEKLFALNDHAVAGLWPNLTFIVDIDVEQGLRRAMARNAKLGQSVTEGRFEGEALAFHERIRQGFLNWSESHPDRMVVLDGTLPPHELFEAALCTLKARYSL